MNVYLKRNELLKLLGNNFHIYEQRARIFNSYKTQIQNQEKEDNDKYLDFYAIHITNLNVKKINYEKDLWFVMHVITEDKSFHIYDDNVSFPEKVLHVSNNPYISPIITYSNEEHLLANERLIDWLLNIGISYQDIKNIIVKINIEKVYEYNVPGIIFNRDDFSFEAYESNNMTIKQSEINYLKDNLDNKKIATKVCYILENIGICINNQGRRTYNYD